MVLIWVQQIKDTELRERINKKGDWKPDMIHKQLKNSKKTPKQHQQQEIYK